MEKITTSTLTVPLPMLTSSDKVACVGENYRWLDLLLFWDCDKTPRGRQLIKGKVRSGFQFRREKCPSWEGRAMTARDRYGGRS